MAVYVRVLQDSSTKFPYALEQLKADFPRTCFPDLKLIDDALLAHFDIFPCAASNEKPEDTDAGTARRINPVKGENGLWAFTWSIVADGQDARVIKLDALAERVKNRIGSDYNSAVDALNAGADLYEMLSWPTQLTEAQRLQNNANAAAPIITALAAFRGVTKVEYAATVISNAQEYNAAYAVLLGAKKTKLRQVRNIMNSADSVELKAAALRAIA